MGVIERRRHLPTDRGGVGRLHGAVANEDVSQRPTGEERHHQINRVA
jgi:hypothetical protein